MRLYIGNKNYSSWSFRPWIAMKAKGVAFEETVIPFDFEGGNPRIKAISPTGKVPVLVDGDLTLWESLAILEYLHDRFPRWGFWPADEKQRALARSCATEMHGGFSALRNACPMNMRRPIKPVALNAAAQKDVARIEAIFAECLARSGGPFLFGEFCNADAMFAPVVNRLEKYALSDHPAVKAYTKAMKGSAAWQEWERDALAETWIVPEDEA
jgi:glutathione S-transferase